MSTAQRWMTFAEEGYRPALSRKSDPASSARAATELVESGRHTSQCQEVWTALALAGPCSSKELAKRSGLDRHMVARRCADLLRQGRVTRTQEGKGDCVWRIAEASK